VIALEAGRTLLLEKGIVLEESEKARISLFGR